MVHGIEVIGNYIDGEKAFRISELKSLNWSPMLT